jgi:hypothetical protein
MTSHFPEGQELEKFVKRRKRTGVIWSSLFLLATTLGVLILMVLLVTIIDDSMGYVATQYKIEPHDLVVGFYHDIVLDAPNTQTSDDLAWLAEQISQTPEAVGVLDEATYQAHTDTLRAVTMSDTPLWCATSSATLRAI